MQVMADSLSLTQRSRTHSVVRDPSSRGPVCRALWQHLMCPWPFGNSKLSVKLHVAELYLESCGHISTTQQLYV